MAQPMRQLAPDGAALLPAAAPGNYFDAAYVLGMRLIQKLFQRRMRRMNRLAV